MIFSAFVHFSTSNVRMSVGRVHFKILQLPSGTHDIGCGRRDLHVILEVVEFLFLLLFEQSNYCSMLINAR